MRTITKIACRTIGAAGLGTALYNASRVSSLFAKNEGLYENQKHLEKAFFDSRTIDSVNYTRNSIREKTFDLRSKNPLPTQARRPLTFQDIIFFIINHSSSIIFHMKSV